ncbi:MAG: ArsA family ATPase [bacterium]
MLTELLDKNLQFILFGGKGGVGKTTMAGASAIQFAKHFPEKKILVFTTDPAPSLADSFVQKFSNEPVKVEGFENLWAMEISATGELEKFKKKYGDDILDILQQGTYLSNEETEEIFSLDIPGLDEVMGLKKIIDFMDAAEGGTRKNADSNPSPEQVRYGAGAEKRGNKNLKSEIENLKFDMYILDTAPTGHTLRLLTLPELLDDWIKFLANLRWKYHYMVDRFSRGKEKRSEKADEFLLEMKKTVKKVQNLLRDPNKTSFVVVTIPEAMGVEETKDLINDLKKSKTPVQHIVINNIVPKDKSPFLQARRKVQDHYIDEIKKSFPDYAITEIELEAEEVRGVERLSQLGKKLFRVISN